MRSLQALQLNFSRYAFWLFNKYLVLVERSI